MMIIKRNEEDNLMEEVTFSTVGKKTVRDDYTRLFNQLLVSKCLRFVFFRSNLKGLF